MPSTSQTFEKVLNSRPENNSSIPICSSAESGLRCRRSQELVRNAFATAIRTNMVAPAIQLSPSHCLAVALASLSIIVGDFIGNEGNVRGLDLIVSAISTLTAGISPFEINFGSGVLYCDRIGNGMASNGGTRHLAKTISQSR